MCFKATTEQEQRDSCWHNLFQQMPDLYSLGDQFKDSSLSDLPGILHPFLMTDY